MEASRNTHSSKFFGTDEITVRFGGLTALKDVSIGVGENEIRGLIGPNGAGKTTFFNVVTNYIPADSGDIFFQGENISNVKPHETAERGIIRTFQRRGILPDLTALENVMTGCHRLMGGVKLWDICFRSKRYKLEEAEAIRRAKEALESVGILDIAEKGAEDLAFGQQTLVEIARSLVSNPKLLLLDEPAAGLSPSEREHLMRVLRMLASERGISLIIADHVMEFVMEICDNLTVLNFGEVLAEGSPTHIRQHKGVLEAYLGGGG
jgi:branched-chain amino acid transport system ATP-binding protein